MSSQWSHDDISTKGRSWKVLPTKYNDSMIVRSHSPYHPQYVQYDSMSLLHFGGFFRRFLDNVLDENLAIKWSSLSQNF